MISLATSVPIRKGKRVIGYDKSLVSVWTGMAIVKKVLPLRPTQARPLVPRPLVCAPAARAMMSEDVTACVCVSLSSTSKVFMASWVELTEGCQMKWRRFPLLVSMSTPVVVVVVLEAMVVSVAVAVVGLMMMVVVVVKRAREENTALRVSREEGELNARLWKEE